LLTNLTLKCAN